MRAATTLERLNDRVRDFYEAAAAHPLGKITDMIGLSDLAGKARSFVEPMQVMGMGMGAPIKPAKLLQGLAGEAGYAYHATNAERLADIAESGKLKPFGPSYGTDQPTWPDWSKEKRIYFGADPQHLWQFAPEHGTPVVLRTKRGGHIFTEATGDLFARKPIDAKALEYLGDDQKWHAVSDLLAK